MAVDEARRHSLGVKAREVLGVDDGETLMEMLPGVGWADVATKHDLRALEDRLALSTRAEIRGEMNRLIMWLVPLNIGLAFAAARLA